MFVVVRDPGSVFITPEMSVLGCNRVSSEFSDFILYLYWEYYEYYICVVPTTALPNKIIVAYVTSPHPVRLVYPIIIPVVGNKIIIILYLSAYLFIINAIITN